MIQIHHARPDEIAAAEALWADTFGDGPDFQREFYRLCAPEGPLALIEDGALCSMLALPELALVLADGRRLRAGYLYALATTSERREQGCAAMLIETAAGLARQHGLDCLLTVPAQPSLFQFFARLGFKAGFYAREETALPSAAPARPIPAEDYAALREQLLAGVVHTAYTPSQLAFQRAMCPNPGSGLYRLELAHGSGCAAVENWADGPVVKELLCHPGDRRQGAAACAALCGSPAKVRTPAGGDAGQRQASIAGPAGGETGGQPFGAVRWLEGTPASIRGLALEGWLGLAFD